MATKPKKIPYKDRSQIEKIESQWHKLSGLQTREEWSAAVVRAATASELAATFVIHEELNSRTDFDDGLIDGLLIWANGLDGKVSRLILPLVKNRPKRHKAVTKLYGDDMKKVNRKRNEIVHGGHFCSKREATALIATCKTFVEGMVAPYELGFELSDPEST
ncbi:hypothetical protein LJR175_007342 [Variovorax sp. LjRoot175]|uniref:hypothetical protein n=1 Tax=Variovorax sp. LjRoot175 TaxID=3342276 RepID=UPI003ED0ED64